MKHYPKAPRQKNRARYVWPIAIFACTYLVRLIFIIETRIDDAFKYPAPGMDVDLYWQAARLIAQGACNDGPCFEQMMCSSPLYPYWISFWQSILGSSMVIHRLFNAFIVSVNAVLIYYLISKLTHRHWTAVLGGFAWAALPSLIFFDAVLYKSSLGILLLTILLVIVLWEKDRYGALPMSLLGVLTALLLSTLIKLQGSTFLVPIPLMLFMAIDKRLKIRNRVLIISATAVSLLLIHFFDPLPGDGPSERHPQRYPLKGVHFRIGFNDQADGTYVRLNGIQPWPYGHAFQGRMRAELELGRRLTPAEADRHHIEWAIRYILGNPAKAIGLVLRKTALFFNNYEVKGVDFLYLVQKKSRVLSLMPMGLGMITILSGLGVIYLFQTRQYHLLFLLLGLLLALLASNLIIFISWRYRIFNVVPLFPLAAFGLLAIQKNNRRLADSDKSIRDRSLKFAGTTLLPMVFLGLLAYYPIVGDKHASFYRQALANDKLSHVAKGLVYKLKRIELRPAQPSRAMERKAMVLNKLHRHSEAYRLFHSAYENDVYTARGIYHYLVYLLWLGDYDRAKDMVGKVRNKDPKRLRYLERRLKGIEKRTYLLFVKKSADESMDPNPAANP